MSEPRIVPPKEARGDVSRESWGSSWIADLAHTAAVLGEQREAVLALHKPVGEHLAAYGWTEVCIHCQFPYPYPTARVLGVTA